MQRRWLGLTAALTTMCLTAGCGLVGTSEEPTARTGRITLGHDTRHTQSFTCTQQEWVMLIDAKAEAGNARSILQIGGERPIVETVNIENFDGLNAVAAEGMGNAEASSKGDIIYTITGTAVVTDMAHPAETTNQPFEIEVHC